MGIEAFFDEVTENMASKVQKKISSFKTMHIKHFENEQKDKMNRQESTNNPSSPGAGDREEE